MSKVLLGACCAALMGAPALAKTGGIRFLNGVLLYEGDPGPVDPAKAPGPKEPDMHLVVDDSGAVLHFNTLYGDHGGATNCVLRHRVMLDAWDRAHPYVRVCRKRG